MVALIIEGAGWEVIDLGVDVKTDKFLNAINEKPQAVVGLSSLLTTTMMSMAHSVKAIKEKFPGTKIIVGGAPVTKAFADKIGAHANASDPQSAIKVLNDLVS